eukprot:6208990-Pleurochrysis_carterae.AAC.6
MRARSKERARGGREAFKEREEGGRAQKAAGGKVNRKRGRKDSVDIKCSSCLHGLRLRELCHSMLFTHTAAAKVGVSSHTHELSARSSHSKLSLLDCIHRPSHTERCEACMGRFRPDAKYVCRCGAKRPCIWHVR